MELPHARQTKKKKKGTTHGRSRLLATQRSTGSNQTSFLLTLGSGCQTRFYHQRQPKKNGVSDESGSRLTEK